MHAHTIEPFIPPTDRLSVAAFLFDVDGVLADTAKLHAAAWQDVAAVEGLPFDPQTADALRGLSREDSLRRILNGRSLPVDRFKSICDRKNAAYVASLESLTPEDALPGTSTLLHDLRRMNISCAAVSASRNARRVLDRLALTSCFNVIIDGRDEAEHPSGLHRFLLAAHGLRRAPDRCVVVEDAAAGAAAARQFGMKCIGIGVPERLAHATLVFESLRGVQADCLLRWLSR